MNGLIGLAGIVSLFVAVGGLIGLLDRKSFSARWLLLAAALVALNDCLLTRIYGLLPDLVAASNWNWEGKILALVATLGIAALPSFGWRRTGLTLVQAPGSLKASIPVVILYCALLHGNRPGLPDRSRDIERDCLSIDDAGL